jgi:hypothetical protein
VTAALVTTWPQVLAWRMRRQALDPLAPAGAGATDIVRRLCGVQAQIEGAEGGKDDAYLMADDVDDLAATEPSETVRLLPGFDQYVLGPGTSAAAVVPPAHRPDVSRAAGWISPIVVAGGRVVGVWEPVDGAAKVQLFDDAPAPPAAALDAEIERVEAILAAAAGSA